MFNLISNYNSKTTILGIIIEKKSFNYILKFGVPVNIIYYIDLYLIFHNINISNSIIVLDIKLI